MLRELGPRDLDEVPPLELATVMAAHARLLGWSDPDAVYRATLQTYGRKLLTGAAAAPMAAAEELARSMRH
ncbi:hypothetical protein GCM10009828_076520 [Actinoplanes couchii]|uniref:Uncharacterized protein n=1 Tax=Actinoplanes couchii TaxID=403638 RepID=A0ABQ3WZC9_9ACTN|nr:hypothetical protein Aco03nite_000440 [Actinoplanes couchii]